MKKIHFTRVFVFLMAALVWAQASAQDKPVTIKLTDIPLLEALKAIESQTSYRFSYRNITIEHAGNVSIDYKNAPVATVLNDMLPPLGLDYKMLSDKAISILKRDPAKDAHGAKVNVAGQIVDEAGEGIIGASVLVKGTNIGVNTDTEGNFALTDVPANAIVTVNYIGMEPVEIPARNTSALARVVLRENKTLLEDVVVIGYGSMRKKDLTGSVVQIKPDNLVAEAPRTVQDVLRGTTGLSVGFSNTAKGGGSMSIRGQRSVYTDGNHNEPLIILDGMMFYGELSEINPNDIAQIDVLKDASSAAVYGARAANGVILITTKKGASEKPIVSFSANVGFSTMGNSRRPMNAADYLNYREDFYTADTYGTNPATGKYEAYQTGKNPAGYYARPRDLQKYGVSLSDWRAMTSQDASMSDDEIWARRIGLNASETTLQNYLDGYTFDWYDQSFRTGLNQDYNVSVSGSNKRSNYYFSLGYMSAEGVVKGNDYSTVRSSIKVNSDITKWLTIGAAVNFQNRTDGDISCNWESQILDNSPFASPYDADGNLVAHPMGENAYWKGYNFFYDRQYMDMQSGYTVFNGNLSAIVKLPFNIRYTFNFAPRYQTYRYRFYRSSEHPDWQAENNERVTRKTGSRFDWSLNNTITWDYTFKQKHHLILTLVQEAEERQRWSDNVYAKNIQPSEALGFHGIANADKTLSSFDNNDTRETAVGYLARLFYAFDDTYMGTFSVRRDGYSAFGINNPYANFYSGALAWRFTNYDWFPRGEWIDDGKLRISYGQNGNRSLADSYIALANLTLGAYTQSYVTPTGAVKEIYYLFVNRLANPGLEWEKGSSWNLGLDLSFLRQRVRANIDFYKATTTDMIMSQSLPNFTGFSSITTNLGKVENTGVELTVNTENIKHENFRWNTTLSFTYNNNKIKSLYGTFETTVDENGVASTKEIDDQTNGWFINHPISEIWNYKVTGIWQTDEVEEAAKYGQRPGDPKVANLCTSNDREDGTPVYNNDDKTFLGQTTPPVNWSLRNSFTIFKDFTLSFNLYSYMGHKSLDTNYLNNDNSYSQVTNCRSQYEKTYWTIDNPSNTYARLSAQGPTGISAPARVVDRSFIRLENISLSYSIPSRLLSKWDIASASVFFNVRNVCTWSKEWEYGDPETGTYAPRNYTFGVNLSF